MVTVKLLKDVRKGRPEWPDGFAGHELRVSERVALDMSAWGVAEVVRLDDPPNPPEASPAEVEHAEGTAAELHAAEAQVAAIAERMEAVSQESEALRHRLVDPMLPVPEYATLAARKTTADTEREALFNALQVARHRAAELRVVYGRAALPVARARAARTLGDLDRATLKALSPLLKVARDAAAAAGEVNTLNVAAGSTRQTDPNSADPFALIVSAIHRAGIRQVLGS